MNIKRIDIQFSQNAIDVPKASTLPSLGCGGECLFVGRTRPENNLVHGELIALNYDCFQEMAEKELYTLAEETIKRFQARHIKVTHAIGKVAINEASVVIAVCCDHRDDAFTACRFIIDLLKQRVPIWKQEMWADGTTWSEGVPLRS
jgi:molybdopterin synthase catalytic subunit